MADAPQLDRPGVEVIQEFATTTPTILRPSLQACIVGPCRQVVEAINDEGTLSPDAIVSIPARLATPFVSAPYEYAGAADTTLVLAVNKGAPRTVQLPASLGEITPFKLVDALLSAQIAGIVARVEESGDQQRAVIETTGRGDNAAIAIIEATSDELVAAFAWPLGSVVTGAAGYDNARDLTLHASDYPDPRTNRDDLLVDADSVRVFISPGNGQPIEVSRDEALLRGGVADITVVDDGDGDALSPYLAFDGVDFSEAASVATVTGTQAPSDFAQVQGRSLVMSVDGGPYQTLVVPGTVGTTEALVDAINALWGDGVASGTGALTLTSQSDFGGVESSLRIDKRASSVELLTALGFTGTNAPFESAEVVHGGAYAPAVGDELWVDGIKLGAIVEVPAAPTDRLRISAEQLLTYTGASYRIMAKALDGQVASAQRPGANLVVDPNTGTTIIKAGLFQSPTGGYVSAKGLAVYVAYDALRLDVTTRKKAGDFNLLRVGSLSDLEDTLSPVDTQNPLALGIYFALLNAPGLEVTGCGVDEVNDGAPEGTADAYARAFEFLESKDIYSLVPLTHSADVGSIAATHAIQMSEPMNGLERVTFLNPMRPTRKSATLVASGARANVNGPPSDVVETGIANLQASLAAAGKPGPNFTEDDAIYLMFEGDPAHYLVQSVDGGTVTVNNGPLSKNQDGYYFDGVGQPIFEEMIVDRPFTVAIRGGAIQNRTDEAVAYSNLGRGYRHKRVRVVAPDTVKTTLDGLEAAVPGYYAAAAVAGKVSAKNPSQPMTEDTVAGFTGVVGAQERYSEPQLRIMCGGGLWVLYQEADGQPIRTRHQLTSDVSTLLARESSITDALDYGAKTLRQTFKNFIGRFNITTGLIEALNLVCDGVRDFFLQNGVYAAFDVVSLEQDANNQDELSVIADITTLKPLNKIRVTMRVT